MDPYIRFEDAEVERICVSNWGRNGGITKEQAARVTDTQFNGKFSGNAIIEHFDELKYFTKLTKINGFEFSACVELISIELPPGIKSIGMRAFWGCSSLTTMKLPDGLTKIDQDGISGCSNLELTELPSSLVTLISGAFAASNKISLQQLPSGITNIPNTCFTDCTNLALTSLPANLKSIGGFAFRGSKITITEIPATVTSIEMRAFIGCSMIPYLHILGSAPFAISDQAFYGTSFKLYVGDGSSQEHDEEVLGLFRASANWNALGSRLDTWWNYLHTN